MCSMDRLRSRPRIHFQMKNCTCRLGSLCKPAIRAQACTCRGHTPRMRMFPHQQDTHQDRYSLLCKSIRYPKLLPHSRPRMPGRDRIVLRGLQRRCTCLPRKFRTAAPLKCICNQHRRSRCKTGVQPLVPGRGIRHKPSATWTLPSVRTSLAGKSHMHLALEQTCTSQPGRPCKPFRSAPCSLGCTYRTSSRSCLALQTSPQGRTGSRWMSSIPQSQSKALASTGCILWSPRSQHRSPGCTAGRQKTRLPRSRSRTFLAGSRCKVPGQQNPCTSLAHRLCTDHLQVQSSPRHRYNRKSNLPPRQMSSSQGRSGSCRHSQNTTLLRMESIRRFPSCS